jgi:hypothetical protein
VAVLSFEKSSYIFKPELSFLPDRSLVASESKPMITSRQNTKIHLALTIFVGPNRTLVVRVDSNRDFKNSVEPAFKNSVEPNRKRSVRFDLCYALV